MSQHRLLFLLISIFLLPPGLGVRTHAQAPADTALYAVSYVEVLPSARAAMVAALKQKSRARQNSGSFSLGKP